MPKTILSLVVLTCLYGLLWPLLGGSQNSSNIFLLSVGVTAISVLALRRARFKDKVIFFKPHLLAQAFVQSCVLAYVFNLGKRQPFDFDFYALLYQICFAFLFDFILTVFSRKPYAIRLYIFPLVLSINIFLGAPNVIAQIFLILCGILLKAYITRDVDGQRTHIFNPSAIVLSLASLILIFHHSDIWLPRFGNYLQVPGFDLFLFFLSLITLWTPNAIPIVVGSICCFAVTDYLSQYFTDLYLMHLLYRGSVFLGITLLVTDPKTSPQTLTGKFIFGILYSLLVMLFYYLLIAAGKNTYYDKILPVPILNLIAPSIDRLVEQLKIEKRAWSEIHFYRPRLIFLALYALVFFLHYDRLERVTYPPYLLGPTHWPTSAR